MRLLRVGDTIKLKDATIFGDYQKDTYATVIEVYAVGRMSRGQCLKYRVEWPDGGQSSVSQSNSIIRGRRGVNL